MVRDGVVEHRVRSLPVVRRKGFRFCAPVGLVGHRPADPRSRYGRTWCTCRATSSSAVRWSRRPIELGIPVVATNHFMPENLSHYLPVRGAALDRVQAWAWADAARVFAKADVVTAPTPYAAALAEPSGVAGPVLPISCGMDLSRFRTGTAATGVPAEVPGAAPADHRLRRPAGQGEEPGRAGPCPAPGAPADLRRAADAGRHRRPAAPAGVAGRAGSASRTRWSSPASWPTPTCPPHTPPRTCSSTPGTAELQSLVTLEAMASGLPVLGATRPRFRTWCTTGTTASCSRRVTRTRSPSTWSPCCPTTPRQGRWGYAAARSPSSTTSRATVAAFEQLYSLRARRPEPAPIWCRHEHRTRVRTPVRRRRRPGSARSGTGSALTAVAVAVAAGIGLHAFGSVDPVNQMLSDTVVVRARRAAARRGLRGARGRGGLPGGRHPPVAGPVPLLRRCCAVWAAGLVALAVFPTNLPGTELTDRRGRCTGTARRSRWPYRRCSVCWWPGAGGCGRSRWWPAGAAVLYGAAHGPAVLTGAEVMPYAGLAERVLFGADPRRARADQRASCAGSEGPDAYGSDGVDRAADDLARRCIRWWSASRRATCCSRSSRRRAR